MTGEGGDPGKLLDRIVSGCFAVLLGAMALYGAVTILQDIWLSLCVLAFVLVVGVGLWLGFRRWRGW
ncbi:hypothetical protein [Leekyejoonella antrihumi]|uniref:hypothetical protein n=1 Tax=Leekyejoonella antrihumi TaxID=1660198 RepID=UPI001C967C29|nr:hypothetical protein [Leekyejoonella antrihumi]